jgi:hypothetical protein
MVKEYRLEMQCFGENEADAVEQAVRMLNHGARFDIVTYLYDVSPGSQENSHLERNPSI